jgi:anaerobic selenocysteine-containing dehydrogenase
VYTDGNEITKIEGDPDNPLSHGAFCSAGMSEREIHNDPTDRIIYPMRRVGERGSGKWERITWEEALDEMTAKVLEIKEKYGPEAIITAQGTGRTWNHWHCRFNSTLGLEGWSLVPTHVCLMPHILPNALTLGVFGPAVGHFTRAKTNVVWGQSPASTLRSSLGVIYANRKKGGKLIVIDVRYTDFAKNADLFIRPRPGTDGALALGIMSEIVRMGYYDRDFIDKWTYGFDELAERLKEWTPEKTSKITWVPEEDITEAARIMGECGPVSFEISLGPGCMHSNAIQNGRAIACLQGLLGYIDVKGGLPIVAAFDVMLDDRITLWDETKDPGRDDLFTFGGKDKPLYKTFGRSQNPRNVWDAIITGEPRPIKMFVMIANDPLLCYEDSKRVYEALNSPNLELIVAKDFYVSPSAKFADILLPSSDWSERDTIDEEYFGNNIFAAQRAVDPPGECWDDWKFFLEWGKRLNPEQWPWKDEKEMVLWRHKEFYGMDQTWDEYVEGGYYPTIPKEQRSWKKYETGLLRPDGQPGFNTQTGRIEFWCNALARFGYDPLPDYTEPFESPYSTPELAKEYPLILTTGFRLYAFFHSAWTNIAAQRELYPYPFALVNPKDAEKQDISDGEWITIETKRGAVSAKAHVTYEIGEGVVGLPRPGWRDECKELGLPGYGWDGANPNVLISSDIDESEPSYGATPMRSSLCRIKKGQLKKGTVSEND